MGIVYEKKEQRTYRTLVQPHRLFIHSTITFVCPFNRNGVRRGNDLFRDLQQ